MNILLDLFGSTLWSLVTYALNLVLIFMQSGFSVLIVIFGTPLLLMLLYMCIRILPRHRKSIVRMEEGSLSDLLKNWPLSPGIWRAIGWIVMVLGVVILYSQFYTSHDRFGAVVFLPVQVRLALLVSGLSVFGVGCLFLLRADELIRRFERRVAGTGSSEDRVKVDMTLPITGICIGVLLLAVITPATLHALERYRLVGIWNEQTAACSFGAWGGTYTFKITGWDDGLVSQFEACLGEKESAVVADQSNFTDVEVGKRYLFYGYDYVIYITVIAVGSNYVVLLAEIPLPRM